MTAIAGASIPVGRTQATVKADLEGLRRGT
jgi:hypothetical protein